MKSLLILGAGEHGHVLKEAAIFLGYERILFLDDNSTEAAGKLDDFGHFSDYEYAICGIGNTSIRRNFHGKLKEAGFVLPVLVHPASFVSPTATIGEGTYIGPMSVVNTHSAIGAGCIISAGAIVEHNATVGDFCHVDSGAIVRAGGRIADAMKLQPGEITRIYEELSKE